MYDEIGWTRYVMTIGTSAIAASSVVVPDLQIPASAAANTSSGSPMCTVIAPGSGYSGGSGSTEVITGVIDEDHKIVALVLERLLDPVQQAVVRGNLGDGLDKPDHGVRFHPVKHADPGALERRAAEGFQLEPRKTAAQC